MVTWFGKDKKPSFLSIDLETRSEVDLGKCGVYKYVEGEHWGILLFCYLFEGDGDVSEIDMASGEPLPEEVLSALEDPEIVKYAWNASFERTNLSKHLGRRLDPRQWKCTMVWAAELSLPLSLKNAAAVLKVDQQKDRAGDALIRKFSVPQKPTKANGMKEWLEPSDLPDQWAAFKSYCRQDVRTEDAIRRRLERFPVPDSEWELYWTDQDINDRGIRIDLDFARAAMECDRLIGEKMMAEAKELTGLENPNSVKQMQEWLQAHGVFLPSLGKELVQEKIREMEADPHADAAALKMLKLRLRMSKSSVKKYEAAVRCTCRDGRARGLFQFYGANRTGRFCLTGDHEVLTEDGWMRLDEWKGGKIACWSMDAGKVAFRESTALRFPYEGKMYSIEGPYVSQISTPEHKMCYSMGSRFEWKACTVREMALLVPAYVPGWRSDDPVEIWEGKPKLLKIEDLPGALPDFKGTVYCAETPTGYFVVRRNGKAWVTGNSGRNIQLQNLSKNHVPYLDDVRTLIKNGHYDALDMLCDDVPDILSQCVRTMLVPKEGHEFIVADFSAIEARCIAWEAGEESTLEDFRNGKDLYCATASRMFGVPVEKHGQNAELRQKGKIAVLACLAEGEPVLTDQGLVPIQDVTTDMKLWDGEEWVNHDGVICRGVKPVYRWCGLTATEDHMVLADPDDVFLLMKHRTFREVWESRGYFRLVVGERGGKPASIGLGHEVRTDAEMPKFMGLRRVYDIMNAGFYHRYTASGVIVHNCGYGGSAGAMAAMGALKMGLTEEELPGIVQAYRDANQNIVRFWWDLDDAATRCIKDHQAHIVGEKSPDAPHLVEFEFGRNVLWMKLPSGRKLAYVMPKIGKNRFGGKSIEFMGVGLNNGWQTIETYGAKIAENCCREGTLVLTRRHGWKPIERIDAKDELWDGEEWVQTKGAVYKGLRAVVEVSFAHHGGLYMTPDHRILTDDGWTEAGDAVGKCWKKVNAPDSQAFREKLPGYRTRPTGWNRISVYRDFEEPAPVYDIMNCGPRRRFCVQDPGTGDLRIVHNCTQAIARDILCNSIRNLEAEGIHVVAHVHDECICEVPAGKYTVDDICSIMARNPEWCKDLPLTAAGYLAPDYYFKD